MTQPAATPNPPAQPVSPPPDSSSTSPAPDAPPASHSLLALPLVLLVRLYQITLGVILPPSCRFTPTCSQYAIQALQQHGPIRGTLLAIYRILRCNPYCRSGYDPVPAPRTKRTRQ